MGGLGGTLPIAASDFAMKWDSLYKFLFGVCVFFFVIVIIPMIYFCIKYRERPGNIPDRSFTHNLGLEFTWTVIPTFVVIAVFGWGWYVYREFNNVPPNAQEIRVVAKQWTWTFQYDDGKTLVNELYVPVNKPIRLTITAEKADVLHSFYVPNFRIKKDAVPGMFTTAWFQSDKIGQHLVFCTEYCGADHSNMMAKIIVLSDEDYKKWQWGENVEIPPPVGLPWEDRSQKKAEVFAPKSLSGLALKGEKLVHGLGCMSCHADEKSPRIGPSYHGLYGKPRLLADGSTVIADENYIRQKIEFPQRQQVQGFQSGVMPSYAGQLNTEEMNALMAYMKSLQ